MGTEKHRPAWWQLWLLLPALGALAFLEAGAPLSATGHKVVEVGIVLAVYGLASVWLRTNEAAWLREMCDQAARREVERTFVLPLVSGAIAGSNGNGRTSEWYAPTCQAETDVFPLDQESDQNA